MTTFTIAGVTFSQFHEVRRELLPGTEIQAVPEPDNKFDPNAVALYYQDKKIGYVPRNTVKIDALTSLRIARLNLYDKTIVGADVEINTKA